MVLFFFFEIHDKITRILYLHTRDEVEVPIVSLGYKYFGVELTTGTIPQVHRKLFT